MKKLLLSFAILSFSLCAFEPGLYIYQVSPNQSVELNAIKITDRDFRSGVESLFAKDLNTQLQYVDSVFQLYPPLMGLVNHIGFYKDNNKELFCFFDIMTGISAGNHNQRIQCGLLRQVDHNRWKVVDIPTNIPSGEIIYMGVQE